MSGILTNAANKKREHGTHRNPHLDETLDAVKKEKSKRLNVDMPESQYYKLREKALEDRSTVTQIVRALVDEYLSK